MGSETFTPPAFVLSRFKKEVIKFAQSLGCCEPCSLRLCGFKKITVYEDREAVKSKINEILSHESGEEAKSTSDNGADDGNPPKKLHPNSCCACLDIMTKGLEDEFMTQVFQYIRDSGYEFREFQIQAFFPPTLTLRNAQIYLKITNYLRKLSGEHIHGLTEENTLQIKEIFRHIINKKISQEFGVRFESSAAFQITLNLFHRDVEQECEFLMKSFPQLFHPKRCKRSINEHHVSSNPANYFNNSSISRALEKLSDTRLDKQPLNCPTHSFVLKDVICYNTPLFIAGRYNKWSRRVSQTEWIVDQGVQRVDGSVHELIEKGLTKFIPNKRTQFCSSGREDVDVRMLGNGRPFVIEVHNPKFTNVSEELLTKIEECINQECKEHISVRDLQLCSSREFAAKLKEGEDSKTKTYLAKCCASRVLTSEDIEKIGSIKNLVIIQKTPLRVLHRRALADRKKTIHDMKVDNVVKTENAGCLFDLILTTEAGTYIKEFVHSDFGRTSPSVATLLGDCDVDIMELDVMDINTDWPPKVIRTSMDAS